MKTIGIIGGLGPPSTLKYYEWLTDGVRRRTQGKSHGARVIINALDGAEVWAFRQSGDREAEGQFFAHEALRLERAGADCVVIASNTSHRNVPWIESAVNIPVIHLAKSTAKTALAAGQVRVALLGTPTTLEEPFYTGVLKGCGLDVVIPSLEDRKYMGEAIYERLVHGIVTGSDVSRFTDIAMGLVSSEGAQAVILGCTELTLLGLSEQVTIPCHDTCRIHVEAALDYALSP